jgi:hypothetical protein
VTLLVVHLVLTAAYAGFQWTVRVLVYPQFAQVPPGTPLVPILAGAACLAVVLGVTALFAVPLHRHLDRGWDLAAHRRLLRVDAVRVAAATAGTAAAAWALLAA